MNAFFLPNTTGIEAETLLLAHDVPDGTYLLRNSSKPGDYAVTVRRSATKISHLRLAYDGKKYSLQDMYYNTLDEFFEFLRTHNSMKEVGGDLIYLSYPFPALMHDPTYQRWYYPIDDGALAESILKKTAKNGGFLVRQSESKPRTFTLSVRIDKSNVPEVTHITINVQKPDEDAINNSNRIMRRGPPGTMTSVPEHADYHYWYDVGVKDTFETLDDLIAYYCKNRLVTENTGEVIQLKEPCYGSYIRAVEMYEKANFLCTLDENKQRNGFHDEFSAIPLNPENLSSNDALKAENRWKNRHSKVTPYDKNRVMLKSLASGFCKFTKHMTNYINASWIRMLPNFEEFSTLNMTYIASQGCLPHTIYDFWRMIWVENCHFIVMLAKDDSSQCEKYWPDDEFPTTCGPSHCELRITLIEEKKRPEHIFRKFIVTLVKSGLTRTVQHYQFSFWPDHWTPTGPKVLVDFHHVVSTDYNTFPLPGPLCVHCNAGIGRTGTFIALDILLRKLKVHGILHTVLNMPRLITMLRSQRINMVVTLPQYSFLHSCVAYFVDKELIRHRGPKVQLVVKSGIAITLPSLSDQPSTSQQAALTLSDQPSTSQMAALTLSQQPSTSQQEGLTPPRQASPSQLTPSTIQQSASPRSQSDTATGAVEIRSLKYEGGA